MKNTMEWVEIKGYNEFKKHEKETVLAVNKLGYVLIGTIVYDLCYGHHVCFALEAKLEDVTHYALITNPNN